MKIQTLRYFVAIAEGKTVHEAAAEFYITQPALSRSIQKLEEELGIRLFERSTMNLQLTPQGKVILPIAKQILYLMEDMHSVEQGFESGYNSIITIGCCGCENSSFYDLIRKIHLKYPEMQINTPKYYSISDMVKKLLSREIDCCFTHNGYRYGGDKVLDHYPVQESHLQVVLTRDHPLASQSAIPITAMKDERIFLWERGMLPDYNEKFMKGCWKNAVYPQIVGEFANKQELFAKVAAGAGIAVLHSTEIYLPCSESFCFVDLVKPDGTYFFSNHISLFWNRGNNNPALPLVTKLLQKSM